MTAQTTDLLWHGAQTIEAAAAALSNHANVALHLPANFHHAVVAQFRSRNTQTPNEVVDVIGGAELLAKLSSIRGLEEIAGLEAPVQEAHAAVHIVSPSPTIAIRCDATNPP